MYKTKNLGLNVTEMPKDANTAFSFHTDLGYNFEAIDSKTVTHRNITNCLLEVPQRIKYTLENGTFTVKAGSVIIVPYGVEDKTREFPVGATFLNDNFKVVDTQFANGKFFVWAELVSDMSHNWATTDGYSRSIIIEINNANLTCMYTVGSGIEDYSGTSNYLLYRTDTNIVKRYSNGAHTENIVSLPLGIAKSDGTYGFGSITLIFNGFGYIGSTIWCDKGVKGLIPNGINEDGSLNNIEFTTPNVITNAHNYTDGIYNIILTFDNRIIENSGWAEYKEKENFLWDKSMNSSFLGLTFCKITVLSGLITTFTQLRPFHAVDYNDYQTKIAELEAKIQALQAALQG